MGSGHTLDSSPAVATLQIRCPGNRVKLLAGFFPSLHLNLADNYCKLGTFNAAREHIDAAKECSSTLADDPYGQLIRGAIGRVDAAIAAESGADWPSINH
jgi:hypothetical protein